MYIFLLFKCFRFINMSIKPHLLRENNWIVIIINFWHYILNAYFYIAFSTVNIELILLVLHFYVMPVSTDCEQTFYKQRCWQLCFLCVLLLDYFYLNSQFNKLTGIIGGVHLSYLTVIVKISCPKMKVYIF